MDEGTSVVDHAVSIFLITMLTTDHCSYPEGVIPVHVHSISLHKIVIQKMLKARMPDGEM